MKRPALNAPFVFRRVRGGFVKEYTQWQILVALRKWQGVWGMEIDKTTWFNFKHDLEDARENTIKRLPQVKKLKGSRK